MKVLNFGVLYFQLPDDFSGNLADALRLMADYHDEKIGAPDQVIGPEVRPEPDLTLDKHMETVWGRFWEGANAGEFRVYGRVGLSYYLDGGPAVGLNLNTGEPE